jgi:hypothetical protein
MNTLSAKVDGKNGDNPGCLSPKRVPKGGCAEAQAANEGSYCQNGQFWHENGGNTGAICRQTLWICAAAILAIRAVMSNE